MKIHQESENRWQELDRKVRETRMARRENGAGSELTAAELFLGHGHVGRTERRRLVV